jgi:hypothetical protein
LEAQTRIDIAHLYESLHRELELVCVEILKVVDKEAGEDVDWQAIAALIEP